MDIFVSVGTGLSPEQEAFVSAVEDRLKAVGLNPCSIGRNLFSTDTPLRAVIALMDRCAGAVVIALERYYFPEGIERRGSDRVQPLGETAFPTSWNQIEASMAYGRGLPLFVLVDGKVRCDGLLEKGNDWFVQVLAVDPAALNSSEFVGRLNDWRDRVEKRQAAGGEGKALAKAADPAGMTVAQLIGALRPAQLWACIVAFAGALAGAFALGLKLAAGV